MRVLFIIYSWHLAITSSSGRCLPGGTGKASDESRATLEGAGHRKAVSFLLPWILQAQHFLAHRTAELFTSFLTKHWSSSSVYTKGVYLQPNLQRADLLLYSEL